MTLALALRQSLAAAALLVATVTSSPAQQSGLAPRELSLNAPAEGIERVIVDAGKGNVQVVASSRPDVAAHVGVRLRRWSGSERWRSVVRWFLTSAYDQDAKLLEAVAIDAHRDGTTLVLTLTPHGDTRTDRIAESWTIELPEAVALKVGLDAGDIQVQGVGGGVHLRLGAGDASVAVPGGSLDLAIEVGDLIASIGSRSLGEVRLASTVGDARLYVHGARFEHESEAGPGDHVAMHGSGRDSVRAEVTVGDVEVKVP